MQPNLVSGEYVIENEDGSTTYVSVEREPHIEPMSRKQAKIFTTLAFLGTAFVVGLPFIADHLETRALKKKAEAKTQKLNKEVFDTLPQS